MPDVSNVIDVHCGWGALGAASTWNDIKTVQREMGSRGVSTVFLSSLLARRYDLTTGNDALATALTDLPADPPEGTPDLRGWLAIHPARTTDAVAQMRRYLYSPQFVGAAVYADPLTGHPVALNEALELFNAYRRFGKPLMIEAHSAAAVAEVLRITEALGANVKIIVSGMGGEEWREAIDMTSRAPHLFFDISGALITDKVEYAIRALHGTRKLLFASGAPQTDPAAVLGMLADLDLPDEDRDRILRTNAIRLFNLAPMPGTDITLTPMRALDDEGTTTANFMIGNPEGA